MYKQFILSCIGLLTAFSSFGQASISGTLHACRLDTASVSVIGTSSTGVWTSSNTVVATVGVTSVGSPNATVTAVWPGTTTLTYTMGGSSITTVSATFTVDPSPTEFAGLTTLCVGSSSIYTDGITGGTWSSSDPSEVTIDPGTGFITGVSPGTPDITYAISSGCSLTEGGLTITSTPTGSISGPSAICVGSTNPYTNTITTGTWSSSNPSIATIDPATGIASGLATGIVILSYTANGICGPASIADTVTVYNVVTSVTLSGPSAVHAGSGISLSASATGGMWSSSNTSVATVNSSGVVTGVSPGTATIAYSVTTCTGLITTTTNITVTALHTGVTNTPTGDLSVSVFPNPTSENLNVAWNEITTETADVTLADVTGKVAYKTSITMTAGAGASQLKLPTLTNGLYILTLKSAHINYNDKVQILH